MTRFRLFYFFVFIMMSVVAEVSSDVPTGDMLRCVFYLHESCPYTV